MNEKNVSVYVHFPYCDIKCAYCDFYSLPKRKIETSFFDNYIGHIEKDFMQKKKFLESGAKIRSIFFGGGTPSKLPPYYVEKIINLVKKHGKVSNNVEITLEANPESLKRENMEAYLMMGVNRLSIGIQTRQAQLLRYLGRLYNNNSYLQILDSVKKAGFNNYSVDLIYGVPSQRERDIKEDIDWAISNGAKHISAYCLSVERATLLENQIKNKEKKKASQRRQSRHYHWVNEYLPSQGFMRYEISNFAREGYESRHNMAYWRYLPYLGLGVSSHSFLKGQRIISERNLNHYLKGKYFHIEKGQVNPDFFIGIFRILTYQSFRSVIKVLGKNQFDLFYTQLLAFHKQGWIQFVKRGFQVTPEGAQFSDTMVYKASLQKNNDLS